MIPNRNCAMNGGRKRQRSWIGDSPPHDIETVREARRWYPLKQT